MLEKVYSQAMPANVQAVSTINDYSLIFDFHQKNVPYRLKLGAIYRINERLYINPAPPNDIQKLNSLIIQTRGDFDIGRYVSLFIDINSSVITFGNIDTIPPGTSTPLAFPNKFPGNYLFQASLGCKVKLPESGE